MARILALDTSQAACSVALQIDDAVFDASVQIPRQHTKQILPLVDQVLTKAGISLKDLDAIAFGRGPGSFTGLRIACGVAQGLGFSVNVPLIPVSSLATLAVDTFAKYPEAEQCLVAFDARMKQVYAGFYQRGDTPELIGNEMVIAPEELTAPENFTGAAAGCGTAFVEQMPDSLQQSLATVDVPLMVDAKAMLGIALKAWQNGETIAAEDAEPAYVRTEITWKKIDQQ